MYLVVSTISNNIQYNVSLQSSPILMSMLIYNYWSTFCTYSLKIVRITSVISLNDKCFSNTLNIVAFTPTNILTAQFFVLLLIKQSDSCVKVLQRGECEPWWTNWSSWSKCTTTCGFHEKHRSRFCTGAFNYNSYKFKVKDSILKSCASVERIHEGVEKVSCPVSRLCSSINGGWSQWSEFTECSVTCGIGKRVRRRHCDHPRPQEGGLYCIGTDHQEVINHFSQLCQFHSKWTNCCQFCKWYSINYMIRRGYCLQNLMLLL